jgi:hypothetical protein
MQEIEGLLLQDGQKVYGPNSGHPARLKTQS